MFMQLFCMAMQVTSTICFSYHGLSNKTSAFHYVKPVDTISHLYMVALNDTRPRTYPWLTPLCILYLNMNEDAIICTRI